MKPSNTNRTSVVSFNPTIEQVKDVENWLIKEQNENHGDGFYCNWNIITSAFEDKCLAVILNSLGTIGFACWHISGRKASLDIVEIRPSFRKMSYGKELILSVTKFLKGNGVMAIDLECSPPSSKSYWQLMGFKPFNIDFNSTNTETSLYKNLILTSKSSFHTRAKEVIELWNEEPFHAKEKDPNWRWGLKFNPGTRDLLNPIIHPANSNWRLRWIKNNVALRDEKIKYFTKEDIYSYGFLIIQRLSL